MRHGTGPPRLAGLPLLGCALDIRRDPLGFLGRVAAECGEIGSFRLGPQLGVLVNSPRLVREVLVEHPDDFDKGRVQLRALRPLLGDGLLTSEGELHERQRRLIAPHFIARRLVGHVAAMVGRAEQMIGSWSNGQEVELSAELNRLSMDIVGDVMLSADVRTDDRFANAITAAFEWEMYAFTHAFPLPLWVPTSRSRRMNAALAYIHSWIAHVIAERQAAGTSPSDMLSMLLEARDEDGRPMSLSQVRDEVLTMCGAAQETSADAMTWTLYLLARHPHVYDQLRAEVDGAVGSRRLRHDDLERLPFALAVFKEAMRLYPPASIMLRATTRRTKVGGCDLPPRTVVLISPYWLHRRPDAFPDAERFDPDRFSRDRERSLPKYAYLPFGAGRRVCLGAALAQMEGQVLTAVLAQRARFTLSASSEANAVLLINLRARDGVRATVEFRSSDPAPLVPAA